MKKGDLLAEVALFFAFWRCGLLLLAAAVALAAALLLQQRAQHPRRLLVDLDALREQVGRGLVAGLLHPREQRARRAHHRLVAGHQLADHVLGPGHAGALLDRGELRELRVGARRERTQRADALGNQIDRGPQLVVLRLEHQVQRLEHGPGDVPVEVVGLQVERVGIGEEPAETLCDLEAVVLGNADVDLYGHDVSVQPGSESQYSSIFLRCAASGKRPRPACWLSSRCATVVVPGIAAVTAGCEMMYFRKNCAHVVAPNSAAAHSGTALPATRGKKLRPRPPNGTLISTPRPCSWASGSTVSAAPRLPME